MNDQLKRNIRELVQFLDDEPKARSKAIIGFDGFVDEIVHVVDVRKNAAEYTRIKTLRAYGERISKAAGLSTNVEMVPIQVKLGGNGPIMSNALVSYGLDVTYIGALGIPDIHPVFKSMANQCSLVSIANPSQTEAVEFEDGKVIVSKLEAFKVINWDNIKEKVGLKRLVAMIQDAKLVGLENWTMVPYMSDIWKGIIREVLPLLPKNSSQNLLFFDLCDPEKRTAEDILEALDLVRQFSSHFQVILGLNLKEASEIADVTGMSGFEKDVDGKLGLRDLTVGIAEKLGLYCLVIHPVSEAAAFSGGEYYHTNGPYTDKPRLTTGAGDNFNAGFCLGQIWGISMELSLLLGTATSGYYVRNAKSPSLNEVSDFLRKWQTGNL